MLCLATLLNANGIAVMAGEPEAFLSLPLLGLAGAVLYGMRREAHYMARPPATWVYLFFAGFLGTGLLSAYLSPYGDPWRAITGGLRNHCASLVVGTGGYFAATHASTAGRVDSLLKFLFWPCAAAAVSGLVLPALPGIGDRLDFSGTYGSRMEGVFTNVNEGWDSSPGIPFCWGWCFPFARGIFSGWRLVWRLGLWGFWRRFPRRRC